MIGESVTSPGHRGPGRSTAFEVPVPWLDEAISVRTWSPPDAGDDEPLPLLVVHDGPDYDAQAGLTGYLAAGVAGTWLPRLRAALLGPGPRDSWYSANPRYARALRHAVLPALTGQLASTASIGMGTSLGALAMLHAHRRYPDAFDALFLQSGSFFNARLDSQERWFPYYRRIVAFVAAVHRGGPAARPLPVVLTCGASEENLANNRLMAGTLDAQGYQATLRETPGRHDYPSWQEAFDPHLTRLLQQACP